MLDTGLFGEDTVLETELFGEDTVLKTRLLFGEDTVLETRLCCKPQVMATRSSVIYYIYIYIYRFICRTCRPAAAAGRMTRKLHRHWPTRQQIH